MISSVNFSSAFRCRRALRLLAAILSAGSVVAQPAPTAIIAHRGGSKLAPENTCAAIRAGDGSADRVEFDVLFLMAPGRWVTAHVVAVIGPGDQGEPVMTIMLPEDD